MLEPEQVPETISDEWEKRLVELLAHVPGVEPRIVRLCRAFFFTAYGAGVLATNERWTTGGVDRAGEWLVAVAEELLAEQARPRSEFER